MTESGQERSLPKLASVHELAAAGSPAAAEGAGSPLAAISNALGGLKKQYFGRGPDKVKTYIIDEYVFCVMKGGLLRSEETLINAGRSDLVRENRLAWQEAVGETACRVVEDVVGRRVVAYHSQVVFDPPRAFEIFVLDEAPGGSD